MPPRVQQPAESARMPASRAPDMATSAQARCMLLCGTQVRPESALRHHAPPPTAADSRVPSALEASATQFLHAALCGDQRLSADRARQAKHW